MRLLILSLLLLQCFSGKATNNSAEIDFSRDRLMQISQSNPDSAIIYLEQWEKALKNEEEQLEFHVSAAFFFQQIGMFPEEKKQWINALSIETDSANIQDHKNFLGYVLMNMGQFDSAYVVYEECMEYFLRNPNDLGLAMSYNGMGNALQNKGNNKAALDKFLEVVNIHKKNNDDVRLAQVYANMGLAFRDLGEAEKAFDYRRLAYHHAVKSGDEYEINFGKTIVGSSHWALGDYDSALYYLEPALVYFENNPDPKILVGTYNDLGIIHSELGDNNKACTYYEKSLDMIRKGGYLFALPGTLANYGTIAFLAGKYEEGLSACKEALPYAVESGYMEGEMSVCDCLHNNFEALGQYDSALVYFKRAQTIKDTLTNGDLQKAVLEKELEMKHLLETQMLQQENELKRQREQEVADAKINKQRVWRNVLISGCIILLVALSFLLISWRNKKKSNAMIAAEKDYLDNLLHNLVHEFRTPLTLIKGPVQELRKEHTQNELLRIVDRNSHKMLDLVNQVLDFAKIKAGKLDVKNETTNLPIFINDTADIFRPVAKQKNISIEVLPFTGDKIVGIDGDKLYKIVSNLLSNAVKYSHSGGQVSIQVESNGGLIKVLVKDQGIGISKEDQTRVFEKFYQVDATTTRKGEGTGLGLAFVKELVILMDGKISVQSTLGKGSTFTVILPSDRITETLARDVSVSPVTADNKQSSESADHESLPKILIVEDNSDLRNYLELLLAKDYQLLLAEDGQEGIEMAIEHLPDLVVSDIMMPKKDGFQVVEELKNNSLTEHIPIMVLTAKASFDSKLKGLSHGADEYLSKPFSSDELEMRLSNQIQLQEKLRKRYQLTPDESVEEEKVHPFVQKFKDLILEHLDKNLSAEELAEHLAISRSQLHRKLKALTGLSTTAMVNQIKLNLALQLLKKGDKNVSEVAYELGYSDPAYFGKLFKKAFGKSPSDLS